MGENKKSPDSGVIFNIQKMSLHDGPGIRTTVFLKGCPLHCQWCSNPESQTISPQLMVYSIRCIGCKKCIEACEENALIFHEHKIEYVDRNKCLYCFKCAEVCPSQALEITGRVAEVSEVISEVLKDRIFYANSGGGVTFSGGEPLFQPIFLYKLLRAAKKEGLHTAVETCGFSDWIHIKNILGFTDIVLYDLKLVDSDMHYHWTGRDNKKILSNLRKIASIDKKKLWIRIPIIPGINDMKSAVFEFKKIIDEILPEKVSLLPYHEYGVNKYDKLGIKYNIIEIKTLKKNDIKWIEKEIKNVGVNVTIGN